MSTYLCVIMAMRLGCTVMRCTLEFGRPRGLCMGDGREARLSTNLSGLCRTQYARARLSAHAPYSALPAASG